MPAPPGVLCGRPRPIRARDGGRQLRFDGCGGAMAILYSGGKIFDGEKAIDGHAVLEEDGRIKRLAPAGEFVSFAGPRIDTSGGTLLPGLIDCHVHSLSGAEGHPRLVQDRMTTAQIAVRGLEFMRATVEGGI